ncbi:Os08g0502101 [Oryza sativa Japonica Group]|uniref:Os08g0502101 protein n=1 Tax=Oryza sativa subsp. japonica TaxID=39947 RepID=C7J629_ORYSJ|nr:Os08g0502101 [Oryza sativa Japonica Group]|eukprot:NP_001175644.1 Os08g0502101 [Oryza sativa Japonica Group]
MQGDHSLSVADILQPLHRPQKQQGVQVVNLPAVCNQHQLQVSLWTVCLPAFDIATQLKACLLQEVKRSAAQKSQVRVHPEEVVCLPASCIELQLHLQVSL